MTLSDNLTKFRNRLNLSRKEVAEKIGVSLSAYTNYEAGNRSPHVDQLPKIAAAFRVSIDDLLGYKPHRTTKEEMLLDEAISHADEVAREKSDCQCGKEHEQLAIWLAELRDWRRLGAGLMEVQKDIVSVEISRYRAVQNLMRHVLESEQLGKKQNQL